MYMCKESIIVMSNCIHYNCVYLASTSSLLLAILYTPSKSGIWEARPQYIIVYMRLHIP